MNLKWASHFFQFPCLQRLQIFSPSALLLSFPHGMECPSVQTSFKMGVRAACLTHYAVLPSFTGREVVGSDQMDEWFGAQVATALSSRGWVRCDEEQKPRGWSKGHLPLTHDGTALAAWVWNSKGQCSSLEASSWLRHFPESLAMTLVWMKKTHDSGI